jgi:hypothetical protein
MNTIKTLGNRYYCIASITAQNNLFSKPISKVQYEDLEALAVHVLDERKEIRHIGFEKPVYENYLIELGKKNKLIKYIKKEFIILRDVLFKLMPEYKEIVKKQYDD